MSEAPVILGHADIPRNYNQTEINKANKSREILDQLPDDNKALVIEFGSHKEARDYRSMLYTMAIFRFGKAGQIGTRTVDNVMYVWKVAGQK